VETPDERPEPTLDIVWHPASAEDAITKNKERQAVDMTREIAAEARMISVK